MDYFTKVINGLIANGFNEVSQINSYGGFRVLTRFVNNRVYFIVITDFNSNINYSAYISKLKENLSNEYGNYILLELYIADTISDELLQGAERNIYDYNAKVLNLAWILDTQNKKQIVVGQQPTELLNLKDIVEGAIDEDKISINTNSSVNHNTINNVYPIMTFIFFGICLILWSFTFSRNGDYITNLLALNKPLVKKGELYRLLTHIFVHGGTEHFICNSCSLFILGTRVEKALGSIKFTIVYILSGILGGICSYVFLPMGVSVGASGAIFGLIGAIIYLTIKKVNVGGFDSYAAILYAVVALSFGFMVENIDNFGHIGGLIGGFIITAILSFISTKKRV